jgi:xylan 1,4-beta-xylosidase
MHIGGFAMESRSAIIHNPILPGFNPDPSIIRVESDYYLVTSTFEWFPAIPLYHSRDLIHWRLVDNLLKTRDYLDLTGVPPSKGVWAPALSYSAREKRFYLVYSNVHSQNKAMFDVSNYLIWTDDIQGGNWEGPAYLNSSGFDPSIFHDDDGRKWLINKDRDFRPGNVDNRAIVIQELDTASMRLLGKPVEISRGVTQRRFVEGAHIYKHDGFYYLMAAEGGTGYGHCVTLARSRNVTGPYEACPYGPVVTSAPEEFSATEQDFFMMYERYNPDAALQKAGHGSLVETQTGEWYMTHLCGRPLMPQKRCVLGRETAIQRMRWTQDGWLQMADGTNIAKAEVAAPALPPHPFPAENPRDEFDNGVLSAHFLTVRNEMTPDWVDIVSQKSFLRIRGQETLSSNYALGLIARRLTAFCAQFTAKLHFAPTHYHHLAGITCYYDSTSYYTLFKTYDEQRGTFLTYAAYTDGKLCGYDAAVPVPADAPVYLRAEVDYARLQFYYSLSEKDFLPLGPVLDMSMLADESPGAGWFTGTFVGMFAQDTHSKSQWAGFDYFEYLPQD